MIQTPKDEGDWFAFANGCEKCWQFPNCVGAIDGKHDNIVKQEKSGSLYFNYKKTFSIILFALLDSECKFAYIDACHEKLAIFLKERGYKDLDQLVEAADQYLEAQGLNNLARSREDERGRPPEVDKPPDQQDPPETKGDRSVWQNTPLQKEITRNTAHLPDIMPTSSGLQIAPVIVGDDAFPLSPNLIKRYPGQELAPPQRIFNYGLSRARRVSENAFGILAHCVTCQRHHVDSQLLEQGLGPSPDPILRQHFRG
ncbi:uncharacterized protein LOC144153512 [Haemaphysalis longicornis]